ncbi:ATP-dependent translocase ABCB1-like [Oscarella lobularis]|uniref:ATP-dependent translocase ABCB1-like n=1 Tax=Oscarella lobularis TaxID=121494 RepID=UPI0033142C95
MEMSAADRSQRQYDVHKASWRAKTTSTSNGVPNGEAKRRKTTTHRSSKVSDSSSRVEPKLKPVSYHTLYQFADGIDVIFILLGSVSAIIHGLGWPLVCINLGQLIDTFINHFQGNNVTIPDATFDLIQGPNALDSSRSRVMFCNGSMRKPDCLPFESEMAKRAIYFAIIGAITLVFAFFQISLWVMASQRQITRMKKAVFKAILAQEVGWFDLHNHAEITSQLVDGIEKVHEGIGDKVGVFIQGLASFVAGLGIAFWKSWEMTLVVLSLVPLLIISLAFISKMVARFSTQVQTAYGRAGVIAEEVLAAIRTVTAFGGQNKAATKYEACLDDARRLGRKKGVSSGVAVGCVYFVLFSMFALAFWYGSKLIEREEMTPGNVLTTFYALLIGTFMLGYAAPNFFKFATATGAAAGLFAILNHKPKIDSSDETGMRLRSVQGLIEFIDVDFSYPSRPGIKILNSITFSVNSGETIALVGASGCGKSTLIQLLQRFYDPTAGRVKLDGHDIRKLNIQWLRRQIGVVSQEPILFDVTIEENIMYGKEDATKTEVVRAAKLANAHSFITKLPKGYHTLVGERGTQLSGGEKQRIAIARAVIRDPKILLLDEATSALDSHNEHIVQEALDKARAGRTTIIVAHRLTTVQNADLIIAIEHGRVAEHGTHAQLINLGGVYQQLVNAQSLLGDVKDDDVNDSGVDDLMGPPPKWLGLRKNPLIAVRSKVQGRNSSSLRSVRSMRALRRTASQVSCLSLKGIAWGRSHSVTDFANDGITDTIVDMNDDEDSLCEERLEGDDSDAVVEKMEEASFMRIMRMNSPEMKIILLGTVMAIVSGGTWPVFAVLLGEVLKTYGLKGDELLDEAVVYSVAFVAVGALSGVSHMLQTGFFAASGEKLTMRLRALSFRAILRQEIGWFDHPKNSTGALTTRLSSDASLVQGASGIQIGVGVDMSTNMTAGLIVAFVFGWKLALVILACMPIITIAGTLQMKAYTGHAKKHRKYAEELGKIATGATDNIRTVAALTKEQTFYEMYSKQLKVPHTAAMKNSFVYGITFALTQATLFWTYAVAFRFGGYLVANGELHYFDVFTVFNAIVFCALTAGNANTFAPDYAKAKAAATHIFHILDRTPAIDASEGGRAPPTIHGQVEFRDVVFSYPTRPQRRVLRGFRLLVRPGQTVAVVGASGCGKSTLVSLLERFYDVADGQVVLDGRDVKDYDLAWLRSNIGIVNQEPTLFNCSIAENIAYGINDDDDSPPVAEIMDDIVEAAVAANIHRFITSLPRGYGTVVGEHGVQLSGGQRQRVAIARALLRDPQILLLDEATSALDAENEKVVQDALDMAREGRTCIVIAHRLSTIRDADSIAVIRNGRVVEMGNHEELLSKQGVYYRLTGANLHERTRRYVEEMKLHREIWEKIRWTEDGQPVSDI